MSEKELYCEKIDYKEDCEYIEEILKEKERQQLLLLEKAKRDMEKRKEKEFIYQLIYPFIAIGVVILISSIICSFK